MKVLGSILVGAFAFAVVLSTTTSCNKDKTALPAPELCPDTISFAGKVEPIITLNCSTSGCHDASSSAAGYNLEGYSNISANANVILNVIRHDAGVTPMPFYQSKLNDSLIEQFDCWVVQGTLDN